MKKKVSIFLPTRKGSKRIKNKNTKEFAGIKGGLLELKLRELTKISKIEEIIVSTNEHESIIISKKHQKKDSRIKIFKRPESLSLDNTNLIDLVNYVPSITNCDHILWTHVTSPFVKSRDYENAITSYFNCLKKDYDSLMSAKKLQNFIWDIEKNDIINRIGKEKWPRTQDLNFFFEVDSAIFLSSRNNYLKFRDRIGNNPFIYELDGFKSIDVDWPQDFHLAEIIHKNFK